MLVNPHEPWKLTGWLVLGKVEGACILALVVTGKACCWLAIAGLPSTHVCSLVLATLTHDMKCVPHSLYCQTLALFIISTNVTFAIATEGIGCSRPCWIRPLVFLHPCVCCSCAQTATTWLLLVCLPCCLSSIMTRQICDCALVMSLPCISPSAQLTSRFATTCTLLMVVIGLCFTLEFVAGPNVAVDISPKCMCLAACWGSTCIRHGYVAAGSMA